MLGWPQALLGLIAAAPRVQLLQLMKHLEFAEQWRRRTAAPGQTKTLWNEGLKDWAGDWADFYQCLNAMKVVDVLKQF